MKQFTVEVTTKFQVNAIDRVDAIKQVAHKLISVNGYDMKVTGTPVWSGTDRAENIDVPKNINV